ncbi:hypothetical protein KQX54_001324 [Cotesia glomerata]|uniref:Uncharacterized protein n=1 Tax=Cotesia glomerata TaxID=32391 RepID=A0AAV7I920_COTGL|nr:hypothetical protein KQX54_001324 [Cotesia glomerata]
MFKKALTESGRRILKAIKKLSTKSRVVTKSQQKQPTLISGMRTGDSRSTGVDGDIHRARGHLIVLVPLLLGHS